MADRTLPKSAEDYILAKISSNIFKIGNGGFSESLIPNFTLNFGNLKWPTEHCRKVPIKVLMIPNFTLDLGNLKGLT